MATYREFRLLRRMGSMMKQVSSRIRIRMFSVIYDVCPRYRTKVDVPNEFDMVTYQ